MTVALLALALADLFVHARIPTVQKTVVFFITIICGALYYALRELDLTRQRNALLDRQAVQLKQTSVRLEQSLSNAAAMNARLNHNEARYKKLVDAQGDAIFRRAPDSRLTYGNDSFFKLFGLNPVQSMGQPFAPSLHPDSRAPLFGHFAGLESGAARVRYDQHVRTAYGYRWMAWEDFAIRDDQGRLVEVQSVGRDITERKALEEAITDARDKAEAGSRAKSGFLATMSHEIRTPMNGVLGMARLLGETELSAEQATYVDAISQSGEALLALIGDILDFSKIESGMLTLDEDEVRLASMLEGVIELSCPRAHAKNIELVAAIDSGVPEIVRADAVRLRQVLTNLVGNAVKFTEVGGVFVRVHVVEGRDRRFLRFDVRDTGVGVPKAKRHEIFDEFVQADSSHARKFGGTGLGLAISKKLVEAMGGEIGIDDAPSRGSCFWFTLPALVVSAAPETQKPLNAKRVAIITRNHILREALTAQIRAEGGEVVTMPIGSGAAPRADIMLIDAGTGDVPVPVCPPDSHIPSFVLITPGARAKFANTRTSDYTGYLTKPVRQGTLVNQVLQIGGTATQAAPATPAAPSVPQFAGSLDILLAEDNPINTLLTRELLRRRGHKVSEVTSGKAAVAAMQSGSYDILLTDIHMPDMDGIEATKAIRLHETQTGGQRTPIVALTADALETGKWACKDAGMDGFLTKPIDPAQLDKMFIAIFPSIEPALSAAE